MSSEDEVLGVMVKVVDSLQDKTMRVSGGGRIVLNVDDSIVELQSLLPLVGENDRKLLTTYISELGGMNNKQVDSETRKRLNEFLVSFGSEVLMARATAGLDSALYSEMLSALREAAFVQALLTLEKGQTVDDPSITRKAEHLRLVHIENGRWKLTKRGEVTAKAYHLLAQGKSPTY